MFQDGQALMAEKPDTEAMVKEKLSSLTTMWEDLESTTQTKAKCLFDANKAELFTQSCADLDKWMVSLEGQLQSDDYGKDLTSVNILLKKQQVRLQVTARQEMCINMTINKEEINFIVYLKTVKRLSGDFFTEKEIKSENNDVLLKYSCSIEPYLSRSRISFIVFLCS